MYEMRNNRLVEKKIKETVKLDRARIQVNRISQFGLMEISRQRLRQSFIEWTCSLSLESCALKAISLINQKIISSKFKELIIEINPILLAHLENDHENEIISIKEKSKVKLIFKKNLKLSNETIIFSDQKSSKNKKKSIPKKKKTVKKKVSKIKLSEKKDINETKSKTQTKYIETKESVSHTGKTPKNKSENEVNEIKKPKAGPKKTGWWSL